MGRILFIRVSADTYDEGDMLKTWPKLCASVWPDAGADSTDSPSRIVKKLAPQPGRGVLALVDAFVEYVHFGPLSDADRSALTPHADTLEKLRRELDEALGDRNVAKASPLTNSIEDALDEAERAVRG